MKAYLNEKFIKLGEKKFYLFGPLASLLSDLILIYYISAIFMPRMLSDKLLLKIIQTQYGPNMVPALDALQLIRETSSSGMTIILFGFFLFHCVIAYNCYKRSAGSIKYLKGYTLSAVLLSIVELLTYLVKLHEFNIFTFMTMSLYFFTYYGLHYFEKAKKGGR